VWRAGRWYSIPVGPDDCSPRVFKNGGSFGRSNRALNSKTRTIRSVTSCKRKKAIVNTSAPKHSRLVPCSDRSPELKSVSRHREWCLFVLGIFAIKFVLLIVDPLPKYYLGDSFSYIYTATSGWIPPDRSYFYGYVIRWLALWTDSLTPLLIVQVCLGGIVAIVAAWICWTIFELPSWASFLTGFACCVDPLQLFWERAVMTETMSLFFYALLLHRSLIYIKRRRISDLLLTQVLSVLLIGFRMSYLALVLILAIALPIVAFTPLFVSGDGRQFLILRLKRFKSSREVKKAIAHCVISIAAMLVLHHAYKVANGFLSKREPDYLYGTGFHLLSFWAPALQPEDAIDLRLAQLIRQGDEFRMKDVYARPNQRFVAGYLIDRWCRIEPNVAKANRIAKQTALRTLEHHPLHVALLAWQSYAEHWRPEAMKHYARLDLEMGTLTQEEVAELATRFHQAITSPNLAAEPLTLTKWYYVSAYRYYFVVLFLPFISFAAMFVHGIAKRYTAVLFLNAAIQFSSTFFLTVAPVVRYLQPLSFLTILSVAAVTKGVLPRSNQPDDRQSRS